ncbi:hypothetical protein [Stratiformator vulcanicus]|uniref:Uncharacterized protein n=1 Tax=Stratiformator vulcanicus TaxID=2527980 RepID=A0A517QXJ4_9PLAN|nr:hypothetical protein [Stratiformator vulcanicus]QDT36361.1 hypothetical protein Pan189_07170 [Stratiformator vulcanicus]
MHHFIRLGTVLLTFAAVGVAVAGGVPCDQSFERCYEPTEDRVAPYQTGQEREQALFVQPPAGGDTIGESGTIGIRGLEVRIPEMKFALPELRLPNVFSVRTAPELRVDSQRILGSRRNEFLKAEPTGRVRFARVQQDRYASIEDDRSANVDQDRAAARLRELENELYRLRQKCGQQSCAPSCDNEYMAPTPPKVRYECPPPSPADPAAGHMGYRDARPIRSSRQWPESPEWSQPDQLQRVETRLERLASLCEALVEENQRLRAEQHGSRTAPARLGRAEELSSEPGMNDRTSEIYLIGNEMTTSRPAVGTSEPEYLSTNRSEKRSRQDNPFNTGEDKFRWEGR